LVRKIISNFLPQVSDILLSIKEAQVAISPNSFPPEVAYPLIEFIEFADRLSRDFPELDNFRGARSALFKCLIYQGIGDETHAVEMARILLIASRSCASEFPDAPAQWPVIRCFVATSLLLQYGRFAEAEESFAVLKALAKFSVPAREALKILSDLKFSFLPASGQRSSDQPILRQTSPQLTTKSTLPSPQLPSLGPPQPEDSDAKEPNDFDDSQIEQALSYSSQVYAHLPFPPAVGFSAEPTWVPHQQQSFSSALPFPDIYLPEERTSAGDASIFE